VDNPNPGEVPLCVPGDIPEDIPVPELFDREEGRFDEEPVEEPVVAACSDTASNSKLKTENIRDNHFIAGFPLCLYL
jgi:hypothetical protein